MSSASPSSLSLLLLNTKRVLAYLRHHGPLRGSRQLFSVFRQLHELRLGDFKGRDAQGNEFYEDRYAQQDNRRRFVVYANSQQTLQNYDATDISPEWHGWLHRMYDETPVERPPVRYEWLLPVWRNRLSKYGFYPHDIAPPGYLPRLFHELPQLPAIQERQRRLWQDEVQRVLARLQRDRARGIEPSPVDLALIGGDEGTYWIRRHRYAGVDDLYSAWRREVRPLRWGGVPLNLRRTPAINSTWATQHLDDSGYDWLKDEEKRLLAWRKPA